VRRELERLEIPGEHEARERAWALVQAAYAAREPQPRERHFVRPVLAAAAIAAVAAAVLSPPGRAVLDRVREAVGVESASEALFELPAAGRVLVTADSGTWVVDPDGSKRRLGDYREASWSPFGRFIVVSRDTELAALTPEGETRWTLARPKVRLARWGGTQNDTRIAYLSRSDLRVVAGDSDEDRLVASGVASIAPAWRPETIRFLAYVAGGRVVAVDPESGRRFWSRRIPGISKLQWSRDGELLLVQGPRVLRVYNPSGTLRYDLLGPQAAPITAATFSPRNAVAFVQRVSGRSQLWTIPRLRPDGSAARQLFSGPGAFGSVAWSPDGRWLLVGWSDADQWLFVGSGSGQRVRAVANVSSQFESSTPPRVAGWIAP
jgi:WD40 repeat protein